MFYNAAELVLKGDEIRCKKKMGGSGKHVQPTNHELHPEGDQLLIGVCLQPDGGPIPAAEPAHDLVSVKEHLRHRKVVTRDERGGVCAPRVNGPSQD